MCGIAGIFKTSDQIQDREKQAVQAMMKLLHHRGPDDEGFYAKGPIALGHKRLSIIDIKGGHQPMANDDESIWITYNGEIYNYIELRKQLIAKGYHFKTQSDTEVLLKLYEDLGPDCVQQLNGMFAFAIWDERQQRLMLCRDRLGIKPLYYSYDGKQLIFASEIKALVKTGLVKAQLNAKALQEYITLQIGITDETLFQGIKKLPAGNILLISKTHPPKIKKYWEIDFTLDDSDNEAACTEQLTQLLEDAVRLQVRSDVPVGAHLSGGLDSSLVCALATKFLGRSLKTFTGRFPEGGIYDESSFANLVEKHLGVEGHHTSIHSNNVHDALEKLIYYMDEPQAGPGLIPQYFVAQEAQKKVKVVLSGLGGDETFGGYARYFLSYLEGSLKGAIDGTQGEQKRFVVPFESLLPNLPLLKDYTPLMRHFWSKGLFEAPWRRYFQLMRRDNGQQYFSKDFYNEKNIGITEQCFQEVFESPKTHSLLNRMLVFDLQYFIPALLQVEDRTSMAVSLESRVPLLDHRIIEFAAKVPPTIKWKGGRPKHIFREAARNLVPQAIWDRKDKRGFPTPITEWFNGPLKNFVQDTMTSKRAKERGIYHYPSTSSTPNFDRSLWGALCIELWHRQFIDQ